MARWLVSQGDRQFAAKDLNELKQLASSGQIGSGDMIQPPGATDWLYATEVPELNGLLKGGGGSDFDDDDFRPKRNNVPLIGVFLAVIAGGAFVAWNFANKLPEKGELDLLGDNGLAMSELLVTQEAAPVHDKPDGATKGSLTKDTSVSLLGKRGGWYHVKDEGGLQGYVRAEHVVPAYFFADKDTRLDYDPLYNPDKYVSVKNASWLQVDEKNRNLTLFQFMVSNQSKFAMTDLVLLASIKDKNGKDLEQVEISIGGVIPRYEATMVGTLNPEEKGGESQMLTTWTFDKMQVEDQDLMLRWSDGVEVEMQTAGFTEASIDILEVRAIPND